MLPPSPDLMPRARAERMLVARVIIAVGLALLLVVGAWSTSRGSADVHATLCLASGVSESPGAASVADGQEATTTIDVLSSSVGICVLAVLGGVALVLVFRQLIAHRTRPLGTRDLGRSSPRRAGPLVIVPALSLTQLSISRT